jgi:DMSO/TMAO reductase YedYZ molybdopterin-dependent catalytic subunit
LESWQLSIEGHVNRPYQLNFSDLLELPTQKVEAVLECSGNAADGSAASNGVWEGVPISFLLEPAGLPKDAAFIVLEGSDSGHLFQQSPERPYTQIVPIQKCLDAASLVAFKLNDLFLPPRNGFPARALFPGWYAMNSVKWLRRIVVLREGEQYLPFNESGMNKIYNRVVQSNTGPVVTRLSALQIKSVISWPGDKASLPAGRHTVWGFAWTGAGTVKNVFVSSDAGATWNPVRIESTPGSYNWIRWSYSWTAPPGDYVLMSRASDTLGNQQPLQRDKTRKDGYELNWCVPLHCSVR